MKKILLLILIVIAGVAKESRAQLTVLHPFRAAGDGYFPTGDIFYDGTYLYGMTVYGGTSTNCTGGCGVIFKIKPNGSGYAKLLDFANDTIHGYYPYGSLISDGTFLYGMTDKGGTNDCGTIFKIKPDGNGYAKLLDFAGYPTDGANPKGSLLFDGTFLYGMTYSGGTHNGGTIFKIKPDGSSYIKLLDFTNDTIHGYFPYGSLLSDGTFLYGMTYYGGIHNDGTIFKIKPDGSGYAKLLDFANDIIHGSWPNGSFISDGTFLYGMTAVGGTYNNGTIFRIKPDGSGYAKLLDFAGTANGSYPNGSLISDGTFLYGMTSQGGTTQGTIFKIKSDGSGYVKLHDFINIEGVYPFGSLITDGAFLYGMTNNGGALSGGTVFKYDLRVGIDEVSANNIISISPNPFTNTLSLSGTKAKGEAVLYDVMGKEMLRQQTTEGETRLNTERLAAGFYMLSYTDGDASTPLSTRNVKVVKAVVQ